MRILLTAEPVTHKTVQTAIDFLIPRESSCVALMERLLKYPVAMPAGFSSGSFLLIRPRPPAEETPCGLCMFSPSGLILYSFNFDDPRFADNREEFREALKKCLAPLMREMNTTCIMGERQGCNFLRSMCPRKILQAYDYDLLEFKFGTVCAPAGLEDFGLSIRKAAVKDAEGLFPLQEAYEWEEVIPPGGTFNAEASLSALKKVLETQQVYALWKNDTPVAKAGTNACGLHWNQFGGVYTLPEWRSKGLARTLVRALALQLSEQDKRSVLFVKKQNAPAKAAYIRAGFEQTGEYSIVYYKD